MAVLLKNLVARTPQVKDLSAISELLALCEKTRDSIADCSLEDLLSHWQQADFHLANDAWVIVTTKGQIVGFACVWHENHERISTFAGVHPQYCHRGIGTLLLRMVEVRARQHIRLARPGVRVVLIGQINKENEGARRLFEREGYTLGRQFLRISFTLAENTSNLAVPEAQKKLRADVSLEQGRLIGSAPLYDRDGLCNVQLYCTYEKELRPASKTDHNLEPRLDTTTSGSNTPVHSGL
jgi:ribosomal protein S18 acetylase RimI-like enzyme